MSDSQFSAANEKIRRAMLKNAKYHDTSDFKNCFHNCDNCGKRMTKFWSVHDYTGCSKKCLEKLIGMELAGFD